jgi:putative serine/threonine protein kinase
VQRELGLDSYEKVVLAPGELNRKEHGEVLCYPGTDLASFRSRVSQLKALGVESLILEGDSKVGKFGIVGRGCVSTVVKARLSTESRVIALKIRRVDANRPDMSNDFDLQKFANSFGVGPRTIMASKDFFAMEYVNATKVGKWFQSLKTRSSKKFLRKLIRNTLEQCYLLDVNGLDHGELSNPSKHLLIKKPSRWAKTAIIDYESASRNRRVANLTSMAQFFLLGSWQSVKVRKILGIENDGSTRQQLIGKLREYKGSPSKHAFEDLLSLMKC